MKTMVPLRQLGLLILFCCELTFAVAHASEPDCGPPKEMRNAIRVMELDKIQDGYQARAGDVLKFDWQLSSDSNVSGSPTCNARIVVMFDFDRAVRFKHGSLVLPPTTTGLYGISDKVDNSRALFEIKPGTARKPRSLSVSFWEQGPASIGVSIFWVTASSERPTSNITALLRTERFKVVNVTTGGYSVAAFDAFDVSSPNRIVQSRDGNYTLFDYGRHFRVLSGSGEPILLGSGEKANFSPTGRFLAVLFEHGLDVYDLKSGHLIVNQRLEAGVRDWNVTAVGWSQSDAFLIYSWSAVGALAIVPTLMDGVEWRLGHGTMGRVQEPGHASSISISLQQNSIDTHYSSGVLTNLANQAFSPERTLEFLVGKNINEAPQPWDRVNWPLDSDFRLSHDLTEHPQLDRVEMHVPKFSADQTKAGRKTYLTDGHTFYRHRPGGSTYIRYNAVFNERAHIPWLQKLPKRLAQFLSSNGLEVGAFAPLVKIYSTSPADLGRIVDAVTTNRRRQSGTSKQRSLSHLDVASFYQEAKPQDLLNKLDYFVGHEKEIFESVYNHKEARKAANEWSQSDLVFFPNDASLMYQHAAHFAFSALIEKFSSSKSILYSDLSKPAEAQLRRDELVRFRNRMKEKQSNQECVGADGSLERVLPWAVRDVWMWTRGEQRIWVIQSSCTAGLRSDWQLGQILVVQETGDGKFTATTIGDDRCRREQVRCSYLSAELASLRVGLVDDKYLLLKGYNNSVIGFDLATRAVVARAKVPSLGGEAFVTLSRDGRRIIFLDGGGEIALADSQAGEVKLRGRYVDDEIVLVDPEGRFVATEDGASYVRLKFNGMPEMQTLRQFRRLLFVPDLLRQAFSGPRKQQSIVALPPPPKVMVRGVSNADRSAAQLTIDIPPYPFPSYVNIFGDGFLAGKLDAPAGGESIVPKFDVSGVKRIDVQRVANNGAESLLASTDLTTRSERGRLFLLSVGFSNYNDERIPKLAFGESDARQFCEAVSGAPTGVYSEVLDLTNKCSANSDPAFIARLNEAVNAMGPRDTLFFFFSGHGLSGSGDEFFLVNSNTNLDRLPSTATRWIDVLEALRRAKGRVVLFLDACHSGKAGQLLTNDDLVSKVSDSLDAPLYVIAASKGRQLSWESETLGGGVFAKFLIHVLTNARRYDADRDEKLQLDEMFSALRSKVTALSGEAQTPWLSRAYRLKSVPLF